MTTCDRPEPRQLEHRGMAWMMGAFVFCPCHLPITLAVLGMILGGTAAGALLQAHPYLGGTLLTVLWAAGTWRGFSLVRSAQRFAYNSRRYGVSQPVSGHHRSEP